VSQPAVRLERRAHAELGDFPIDMAWSPDGRILLVAGGAGALTWLDTSSPALAPQRIGEHAGGALALAWQNGGQQFASSGQDGEVRLWDARTRAARVIHSSATWSERLAWSANGRALAVATGRELAVFASDGTALARSPTRPGARSRWPNCG